MLSVVSYRRTEIEKKENTPVANLVQTSVLCIHKTRMKLCTKIAIADMTERKDNRTWE